MENIHLYVSRMVSLVEDATFKFPLATFHDHFPQPFPSSFLVLAVEKY